MRKNIENVIQAFLNNKSHQEKTCRTNGKEIFSYNLVIAKYNDDGSIWIHPRNSTRTTNSQISAIQVAVEFIKMGYAIQAAK